jgi:hypothetical protein
MGLRNTLNLPLSLVCSYLDIQIGLGVGAI